MAGTYQRPSQRDCLSLIFSLPTLTKNSGKLLVHSSLLSLLHSCILRMNKLCVGEGGVGGKYIDGVAAESRNEFFKSVER